MILFMLACTTPAPTPTPPAFDPNEPLRTRCFGDLGDGAILGDYDQFSPIVPEHCLGTDHQTIDAVGKVVFLGDSITAGTPPTPASEVYRARVIAGLTERFGMLDVMDCSEWGAEMDDLPSQIEHCFADSEPEPVLVIFTVGGNDMVDLGQSLASGQPTEEVQADFEARLGILESSLQWFRDEDERFSAGVNVIFGNVYEYTDGTNDVGVCPLADLFDVPEGVDEFREGYVAINEAYIDMAVRTQTDVLFLFEHFCGHGFFHDDPENPCYRGPDTEKWFDDTCIHPNPRGHLELAEMVLALVD